MKFDLAWLTEHLERGARPRTTLADRLTSCGFLVETARPGR